MLTEFFSIFGSAIIAVVIVLPLLVFHVALFFERTALRGYGTPDARNVGTAPAPQAPAGGGGGGLGSRRVVADRYHQD